MKRTKSFNNEQPLLYLVATPIGNLKEISARALEVLSSADLIAAEDTRNTYSLLEKYSIKKPLFSLREHNETEASNQIISLLLEGKKVAYVSDAGYPGISDPGQILVKHAIEQGIAVSTVSGPSAFLNALVSSGLASDHFYFYGFISPKDGEANKELSEIKNRKETTIFYESPHRIKRTLNLLYNSLGDRKAVIARELTKLNEEYIRGSLKELAEIDETTLIGEMVIIVEGQKQELSVDEKTLENRVNELVNKGVQLKTAIEITSEEYQIKKNDLKKMFFK